MSRITAQTMSAKFGRCSVLLLAAITTGILASSPDARGSTIRYVDDDAPSDPGPGDPTISDPAEDGSFEHPFDAIQEAIDAATDGDYVVVLSGLYGGEGNHSLSFGGRAITVRSIAGPQTCVIECAGDEYGFRFHGNETANSVLEGFTIAGDSAGEGFGINCGSNSSPTISDCVVTSFGAGGIYIVESDPLIVHCEITENLAGGVTCDGWCSPILFACTIARNSAGAGGGISCWYEDMPLIVECEIVDNTATEGGGVFSEWWSDVTIIDSVIARNVATDCGGGVHSHLGDMLILDSSIRDNLSGWDGGGIWFFYNSIYTIIGSDISENTAGAGGGGLDGQGGILSFIDCTVTRNRAGASGGGVYYYGTLHIDGSEFTHNEADIDGFGGGIDCHGYVTITNSTFVENLAGLMGGGIYGCHNLSLTNCTMIGNVAGHEGGGAYFNDETNVSNCILWSNSPDQIRHEEELLVSHCDIQGGWPDGEGNIDLDPRFVFADDLHLLPDSPCVDAGTNDPPDGLPDRDMEGRSRRLDGDDDGELTADMGAYELSATQPTIACSPRVLELVAYAGDCEIFDAMLLIRNCGGHISGYPLEWHISEECSWLGVDPQYGESNGEVDEVTISVDATELPHGIYESVLEVFAYGGDNSPRYVDVILHVASGYPPIQPLIDDAADGDTVVIQDGIYTGPENRNLDFGGKAITLVSANGPENCIIDCEHEGRGFVFQSSEGEDSVVEGFTITNGLAVYGGGIRCSDGSPTIQYCVISGNSARQDGGGVYSDDGNNPTLIDCVISENSGGGVYGSPTMIGCYVAENDGYGALVGNADITGCTFVANTGPKGAGIWCGEFSYATITNCIFEANQAEHGGALYCDEDSRPKLSGCTIRSNVASVKGGGICSYKSNPIIQHCVIQSNYAANHGGGIFFNLPHRFGGSPKMYYCLVSENTADSGHGGGINLTSTQPIISQCVITDNTAREGGGIFGRDSDTAISNCVIARNMAEYGGGIRICLENESSFANCMVWNNQATIAGDGISIGEPNQPSNTTLLYNDLRSDSDAVHVEEGSTLIWGDGNIDSDPLFSDPDGGDFHLQPGSPCIDAGSNQYVSRDYLDLDYDGNTHESTPFDLDGLNRFADDPDTPDTGSGTPPIVDMGPYEFGSTVIPPCVGDVDGDRDVDMHDLAWLLLHYGMTSGANGGHGDMDHDHDVDISDLAVLLAHYGEVCE